MKKTIIALALSMGFAGVVSAENTVLVTHGGAKGAVSSAALDFQTSGDATAFQFLINLPKGTSSVDTSRCLVDLPKSHTGTCAVSKDQSKVAVVVFSASNSPIPAGMQSLGTISYRSGGGEPTLDKVLVAGADGHTTLPSSPKVVSVDSGRSSNRQEQTK